MPRLIDADALHREFIDFIRASNNKTPNWNDAVSLVGSAPTVDAVQVVRCKDCKHRTELCGVGWHPCTDMAVNNNWYCADGERKEDA